MSIMTIIGSPKTSASTATWRKPSTTNYSSS